MILENKTIYVDFDNTLCLFKQLPATEEIPAVTELDVPFKDDNVLRNQCHSVKHHFSGFLA